MKISRCLPLTAFALVLGTLAFAQDVERVNPTTTVRRAPPARPPAYTVHRSGATKTILRPFGNFITQTGVGAGFADISELYTLVGYNTLGWGMQTASNNSVADNFIVPPGQVWIVADLGWITYQTGASTSCSITDMNMNLWNTDPEGQLPGNEWLSGVSVWKGSSWTGVYRVTDVSPQSSNRAECQANCDGSWTTPLGSGEYWLEANASGSLPSGPWAPPAVEVAQTPPTGIGWDGLQSVGGNAFAQVFDTGYPPGSITEPAEWLFQLEGSVSGGGGVQFCTSKPTSIAACTPTFSISCTVAPKGGSATCSASAGPAPGGGNPGILIFNRTGPPAPPVLTGFGYICVIPFLRAGSFPLLPGGTPGSCSGNYSTDLQAIVNATPQILPGDTTFWQLWYRDSPNPGGANMTNAVGPITH